MNMYTEKEQVFVQEQIKSDSNGIQPMNQSIGYAIYDTLRKQNEELHEIKEILKKRFKD